MLPFTREQFLGVFADYNTAVWPAQVVAYVLGLIVVAALDNLGKGAAGSAVQCLNLMCGFDERTALL